MTGSSAHVGGWLWRGCLIASFHVLLALALKAESPSDVSELESYKRRLQSLEGSSDPARVAQLRQMQRLLTLMQRSLIIKEANSNPPPPPAPEPAAPEPVVETTPSPDPDPQLEPQPVVTAEPEPVAVPVVAEPQPKREVPSAPPSKQVPVAVIEQVPDEPHAEPEIPAWFFQVELSTSVGFQENILRSAFSDLDSTFIRGAAELQLLNLRREDFRVMALGHYDRKHFLDESSVRDEDLLFMLGQVDRRMRGNVWLGLDHGRLAAI